MSNQFNQEIFNAWNVDQKDIDQYASLTNYNSTINRFLETMGVSVRTKWWYKARLDCSMSGRKTG